jgi:putative DNA methylase
MCQWLTSFPRVNKKTGHQLAGARDIPNHVFYNQALNTFVNYAGRSVAALLDDIDPVGIGDKSGLTTSSTVSVLSANEQEANADYWITDPP